MKQDWKPSWETENRLPAFPSPQLEENIHYRFGKETHLWGNVPAVDVLNLPHNEGSDFPHDLAILFAGWLSLLHSTREILADSIKHLVTCETW